MFGGEDCKGSAHEQDTCRERPCPGNSNDKIRLRRSETGGIESVDVGYVIYEVSIYVYVHVGELLDQNFINNYGCTTRYIQNQESISQIAQNRYLLTQSGMKIII